jgi:hypothetical protein
MRGCENGDRWEQVKIRIRGGDIEWARFWQPRRTWTSMAPLLREETARFNPVAGDVPTKAETTHGGIRLHTTSGTTDLLINIPVDAEFYSAVRA